jgi:hypothetical protein
MEKGFGERSPFPMTHLIRYRSVGDRRNWLQVRGNTDRLFTPMAKGRAIGFGISDRGVDIVELYLDCQRADLAVLVQPKPVLCSVTLAVTL